MKKRGANNISAGWRAPNKKIRTRISRNAGIGIHSHLLSTGRTAPTTMDAGRFVIEKGNDGRIIAVSKGCIARKSASDGIGSFQPNVSDAGTGRLIDKGERE
ncbi:MAG: hypothetical protein J5485_04240 [Candidatus Methanomethylophilaceae archaeon]|nr:hypothetical protein [Candidatus Methanomethylophilaceae archaeon]